jgi:tetratricopeptide (TPR) repeat protein
MGKLKLLEDKEEEAEGFLLKSLEEIRTFEFSDSHIKEGVILEALGNLYHFKNDPNEAINYFILAVEIFHKFGEDLKISDLYKKIAYIYLENLKDHIEAIFYLEKSLDIYESMGYLKESAEIYDQIGDIYVNKNMRSLAIKSFRQAKSIYKELKDSYHNDIISQKIKTLNDSI